MRVFISWSGERSGAFANALRDWLPLVLHYVEPWLSKADIGAGERWGLEVAKELGGSAFGICCITRGNANAPWILFEAGALAKSLDEGRLVPLLIDVEFSDISGPLAQFQAKKADKAGIFEILNSINQSEPNSIPEPRLTSLFDALWPQLEAQIQKLPASQGKSKLVRPQSDILEELVATVRNLEARTRESQELVLSGSRFRDAAMRGMLSEELAMVLCRSNDDPMRLLILSGAFRDSLPWLYDLLQQAHRAITNGSKDAALQSRKIIGILESLSNSPYALEEFGFNKRVLQQIISILAETGFKASMRSQPTPGAST